MNDEICKSKDLKIILFPGEGFLNYTKYEDGRYEIEGNEGKLLHLLIDFLGITAHFFSIEDVINEGNFEDYMSVGKFTVLIESLYSAPYEMTYVTFAVRKSVPLSTRFAFLYPFTLSTWLGFFTVMILIPAFGIFLMKKKVTYLDLSLQMLGSFLRQGYQVSMTSLKIKIFFLFWLFFSMVVTFSYSAVFFSLMVNPLKNPPVTNFQELSAAVTAGTHTCHVYDSKFVLNALKNSPQAYMKQLSKFFEENKNYYSTEATNDKENVAIQGHVLISDEIYLRQIYGMNSEVFISNDGIANYLITSHNFDEKFCLKKRVNLFMSRAWSAGLYQKILKDEQNKATRVPPITVSAKPLSLKDISGVIIIFIAGITISFFALIMEIVIYHSMKLF